MASLLKKSDSFDCRFYYFGRRFTVTVGEVGKGEAEDFAGGQVSPTEQAVAATTEPASHAEFRRKYLATHQGGSMEANSFQTTATRTILRAVVDFANAIDRGA